MRFYFVPVALLLFIGQELYAKTSTTICADKDVEFALTTEWPNPEGKAEISGAAIKEWLPNVETPISMPCLRQGGSSMPPWWTCKKDYADGKTLYASFYSRDREAQAKIQLRENGTAIAVFIPECQLNNPPKNASSVLAQ
jgi:hypothetical protein